MSDFGGYAELFNDRPNQWLADGYVTITDGSGTPSLPNVPSGIVKSVARTGVGAYTLTLSQNPVALVWADVKSIIPGSLSPAYCVCQLRASTIGLASAGANPTLTFVFNVAGTPTELPSGSGFLFALLLTES